MKDKKMTRAESDAKIAELRQAVKNKYAAPPPPHIMTRAESDAKIAELRQALKNKYAPPRPPHMMTEEWLAGDKRRQARVASVNKAMSGCAMVIGCCLLFILFLVSPALAILFGIVGLLIMLVKSRGGNKAERAQQAADRKETMSVIQELKHQLDEQSGK